MVLEVYKDHIIFVDERMFGLYGIVHVCGDIKDKVNKGTIEECFDHINLL